MQTTATKELEPGAMLDHYRIEAVVARTGMSVLYKATDTATGLPVAIKVPYAEMEADPVLFERFKREEEIGQLLDHHGIVKSFEHEERTRVYMVLEWVEGHLLRAELTEKKLPIARAEKIALGMCEALDYMHKRGVVHRDLKPENVMLDEQGQIKLIDFGIAMMEDARRLTYVNESQMLGTPDYISPEQVKGQRGDQRSDIYAAGVILYEMLTGRVPFLGASPLAAMNERLLRDPTPPRALNAEISPELEEIVFRALERNPRHRYANAHEMAWDLEHQEQVGVAEREAGPVDRGRVRMRNRLLLLYVGLALVPIAVLVLMLVLGKG
ncbi:MAG TPA: serine/threonine-protein kinase [Terracidiphilus sp.]|nr:serine/threonine-protein kinase [Terracidiphilus sp.]